MLKLDGGQIKAGTRVFLPERWHEKLVSFGKLQTCPYEFEAVEVVKVGKATYYICEADKKERGKKIRIALTEFSIKYLLAQEVPDSNIGFSFKEYLPTEDSQILITNVRNPSEVVPGVLKVETVLAEIGRESLIAITITINYTNGTGFADVKYYSDGSKKSTWKFLLHEDESYMTDYEKMFRDTVIHRSYVQKSANKLARYFENEGATEHARMLRERAIIHDESKISCVEELMALSRIINDKSSLRDADKQLSIIKQDAIRLHWKHNSHHPEHFATAMDMSKLDIMEMCCDWHARSTQYKTNFLEFVKKQQENRFHFPDWMFQEIWQYCLVLASEI